MAEPIISIAVPSLNQGEYLDTALTSIFSQDLPVEVFVMDGGSTDSSIEVIENWQHRITHWQSGADGGQAAAINEGISRGSAPYVCWLNSDDYYFPAALRHLVHALGENESPAVYAHCWNVTRSGRRALPYVTLPFSEILLSNYCFIAQPSTLIRRSAWEAVGGLDETLKLAMDYDLWWRLYGEFGRFRFCNKFVSANRFHAGTKTQNNLDAHYAESIDVVNRHYGKAPLKWKLALPLMRLFRATVSPFINRDR